MKNLLLCLFTFSMALAQTDKVKFTAIIQHPNSDSLQISKGPFKRKININSNGIFQDTFAIEPGIYSLEDGKEWTPIYFRNGFDLLVNIDTKAFDETIKYSGTGEMENNFLASKFLLNEKFNQEQAIFQYKNDYAGFKKLMDERTATFQSKLDTINFDLSFLNAVYEYDQSYRNTYEQIFEPIKNATNIDGRHASSFAYENHKGGIDKLEDFEGKYVFIDIWATWCAPCIREIPFLEKLEKKYVHKNIVFISISIDSKKTYQKWKSVVSKKNMGGIQLIADNAEQSDFIKACGIVSIPRFILIDPDGIIVASNAYRPSEPELQKQLDTLLHR